MLIYFNETVYSIPTVKDRKMRLHIFWDKIAEITFDSGPYDTIRHDIMYLACSKKLTCSQLSPPHKTNKKLKKQEALLSQIGRAILRVCIA